MFLIYDKDDGSPVIAPNLEKVAKFLGLTLASLRSYICIQHPIKNGSKIYEIKEVKTKHTKAKHFTRRIL